MTVPEQPQPDPRPPQPPIGPVMPLTSAPSAQPGHPGQPAGYLRADPMRLPARQAYTWPFLLTVGLALAGLVTVALDHFRRGTVLFALAFCLASVLRLVVPAHQAGLLRVRTRWIDVACLAALGGAALVVALVVPPPS